MQLSGGTVDSWLVRSTPDQVVQVWVLAGDNVLCSLYANETGVKCRPDGPSGL